MPLRRTAVVIEAQTELGRVIRDVLREEGYEVVPVLTAEEALGALREQRVDLLVSDLPEPDSDTTDPLGEVAGEFPDLRVIELSEGANDPVPFFGPWRTSGSRVTLRRPFRLDDLIAASRELAGLQR
jgi:CheY-like chemotaxis protein